MFFVVSGNKKKILYVYDPSRVKDRVDGKKYHNEHSPLVICTENQLHFRVQNLLENSLMRSIMANMMQHNEYVSPLLYDKETP